MRLKFPLQFVIIVLILIFCIYHNFTKTPKVLDILENIEDPGFRVLTFFSSNHFEEALESCQSLSSLSQTRNWKHGTVVAYIHNDVSSYLLLKYTRLCPAIEIRRYHYQTLPKHVEDNLLNYAFKPILIQKFMKESDRIIYVDSSAIFQKNTKDTFNSLFDSMGEFPCGIRSLRPTWQSVISGSHPKMLQHFNFSEELAKKSEMVAGGIFVLSKTNVSQRIIDAWAACAMEEDCISPLGSEIYCDESQLKSEEYIGCHRFDQSAFSILLYKCNSQMEKFYRKTDLIKICRDGIC